MRATGKFLLLGPYQSPRSIGMRRFRRAIPPGREASERTQETKWRHDRKKKKRDTASTLRGLSRTMFLEDKHGAIVFDFVVSTDPHVVFHKQRPQLCEAS
jgi:hypothetical protein